MILLTVNTRMTPLYGTNFKPSKAPNTHIKNNFSRASLAPNEDTFVKNNDVSFKGLNSIISVGRCDSPDYNKKLQKALTAEFDKIWDWAQTQDKYAPYFEEMKINKPIIHVTESTNKRLFKNTKDPLEASAYLWVDNSICLNRSFAPNMIFVSMGKMALIPQIKAVSYAQNNGCDPRGLLEMLEEKKLTAALNNSNLQPEENYFHKLNPEQVAAISVPYLARGLDYMIMTHVLFNTAGISKESHPQRKTGNFAFEAPFRKLQASESYPEGVVRHWDETYPFNYQAKEPYQSVYNIDDIWELDAHDGFIRRFSLGDVFKMMIEDPKKHMTNHLDLSGQTAALEYLEQYTPKRFGDDDIDNMMDTLMEYQKVMLRADIKERKEKIRDFERHLS